MQFSTDIKIHSRLLRKVYLILLILFSFSLNSLVPVDFYHFYPEVNKRSKFNFTVSFRLSFIIISQNTITNYPFEFPTQERGFRIFSRRNYNFPYILSSLYIYKQTKSHLREKSSSSVYCY